MGGGEGCPAEGHAEADELGVAAEVPRGAKLVGEVVVVVLVEGLFLGDAPGFVVAFVEGAGVDGEGGDADAGEGEVVGAVVAAGLGAGVGDDGEVRTVLAVAWICVG